MMQANIAATMAEVTDAIDARRWRLGFTPVLEARFERDTEAERCRRVVLQNYIGLSIYNAFMAGDWLLIRDVFSLSVGLHLLVMTPIMFAVNFAIRRRPPVWLREGILSGGIILTTIAILGLMWASRSPLRTSEHLSIVLVILFATMVQRIRFPYVAAACAVSFALYVGALLPFAAHDPARMIIADAICACVILFSLIGCYNLETEQRTSYLLSLRDRLRNQDLVEISRRDPLTGAGNRRALDAIFEDRRSGRPPVDEIAVLLCDIDFFKAYNDANGHLGGDDCLKRIAGLIGANVRHGLDRVYRFGGEEFLVVVEELSLVEASALGERIRAAVETAAIRRGPRDDRPVTLSIGVAAGALDLPDLISQADLALYEAKHGGRNQVRTVRDDAGKQRRASPAADARPD